MSKASDRVRQKRVASLFVGKTIKSIDVSAANVWVFQFTDGTEEKVWAEQAVNTGFGSIPGLFLSEEMGDL